jgi:hypothetical protein
MSHNDANDAQVVMDTVWRVLLQYAWTTIRAMLDFRQSLINSTLREVLKRLHYPLEVMLTCVRWYVA